MFLLIKLTALFFILAINTLSVSAEDVSKISEETFKDKVEVLPSPIKDTKKPKSLMYTELSKSTAKTTHIKVLDPSLKKINSDILSSLADASLDKNDSDSSIAKIELFTPIDSLKKHPGSIVLSLKDASFGHFQITYP